MSDKMTIEKAREITSGPEQFLWPMYSKFSHAKGFIEGYESRDAKVNLLKSKIEKLKDYIDCLEDQVEESN